MSIIYVEIETAIRNVSWYTQQVGQKSLHQIAIDFNKESITSQYLTGTTKFMKYEFGSIRDSFFVDKPRFVSDRAFFRAKGQTATAAQVMPDIDYSFDIELGLTEQIITFSGSHDGYPSYNISVNGISVYDCVQGHIGQLVGRSDVTVLRQDVSLQQPELPKALHK